MKQAEHKKSYVREIPEEEQITKATLEEKGS